MVDVLFYVIELPICDDDEDAIYSQKQFGIFVREKEDLSGKFITEFFQGIQPFGLEEVDISSAISTVFAVKSQSEQECIRHGGNVCKTLMKKVFVPEMNDSFGANRIVKHSKMADKVSEGE